MTFDKSVTRGDLGWGLFHGQKSATDRGLVMHYDGANQGLLRKGHAACRAYWERTRQQHIDKGWLDIGYSYGVCPHGVCFTGRGYGFVQAAQKHDPGKMEDGNTRWVSCTLMSGPDEHPTAIQAARVRELRAWCMAKGMHSTVSWHGRFSDTDCPGELIIDAVKAGAFQ